MNAATTAVYAARDKMNAATETDIAEREQRMVDPTNRARYVENARYLIDAVNRAADLVATWEPLPVPAPVPVEVVEEWHEVLTAPFERLQRFAEEDRRQQAVRIDLNNQPASMFTDEEQTKPVKQSTEAAADRLFALITHAARGGDPYRPNIPSAHRVAYVQVFGDKDIGKLSPKNVAAKIPEYVSLARDTHQGSIRTVVESAIPDPWHRRIAKRVDRHMKRAVDRHHAKLADPPEPTHYDPNRLNPKRWASDLPQGRLYNALAEQYRLDIPIEWRRAYRREVDALIDHIAGLSDMEHSVVPRLISAKLSPLVTTVQWDGNNEDADVDELVDELLTSPSWASMDLDVRLDANHPLLQSGRWAK